MVKRHFTIWDTVNNKRIPLATKRKSYAIEVFKTMRLKGPCKLFLEKENKYYSLTDKDINDIKSKAKELNLQIPDISTEEVYYA